MPPEAERERSPNSHRIVKKLQLTPPLEVMALMDESTTRVVELVGKIDVIEYDSGKAGDLLFLTSGMHGEETKERISLEDLDKELNNPKTDIISGKVIIIPILNKPGYEGKTRHVFKDESDDNLNDVFDQYQTGAWEEFLSLKTKTAKYGWLIMKYLIDEKNKHVEKFGPEHQARLIDIHREDSACIPYNRIDRMYEDQEELTKLFNAFKDIPLPLILEDMDWAKGYQQTLTAVASSNGIAACTIEEGRTANPEERDQVYLANELIIWLENQKVIEISDALMQTRIHGKSDSLSRAPAMKKSRQFWKDIVTEGRIYCPSYRTGEFINNHNEEELDAKGFVAFALNRNAWDGTFTVIYESGLRGTRNPEQIATIAGIIIGNQTDGAADDADITIYPPKNLPSDWFILSVPEGLGREKTIVRCAFTHDEKDKQLTLKIIDEQDPVSNYLSPDEIKELLTDETIKVDLSALEMVYALPDPIWTAQIVEGAFQLIKK
jgi:predicted deacylase